MRVFYRKVNFHTNPSHCQYHLMILFEGVFYQTNVCKMNFNSKILNIAYLPDILQDYDFGWNTETEYSVFRENDKNLIVCIDIYYQSNGIYEENKNDNVSLFLNKTYCEKFKLLLKRTNKSLVKMIETENFMMKKYLNGYKSENMTFYSPQVLERMIENSVHFSPSFYFSFSNYIIDGYLTFEIKLYPDDLDGGEKKYDSKFRGFVYGHPKFLQYRDYFQNDIFKLRLMLPDLFQSDMVYQRNKDLLQMDALMFCKMNKYSLIHPKLLKLFLCDIDNLIFYPNEKKLQTHILLALYEINLEYQFLGKVIVPAPMFYRNSLRVVEHPDPTFRHKFNMLKYAEKQQYEACSDYKENIIYNICIGYYKFRFPSLVNNKD
jgi:hypothetical protein